MTSLLLVYRIVLLNPQEVRKNRYRSQTYSDNFSTLFELFQILSKKNYCNEA